MGTQNSFFTFSQCYVTVLQSATVWLHLIMSRVTLSDDDHRSFIFFFLVHLVLDFVFWILEHVPCGSGYLLALFVPSSHLASRGLSTQLNFSSSEFCCLNLGQSLDITLMTSYQSSHRVLITRKNQNSNLSKFLHLQLLNMTK